MGYIGGRVWSLSHWQYKLVETHSVNGEGDSSHFHFCCCHGMIWPHLRITWTNGWHRFCVVCLPTRTLHCSALHFPLTSLIALHRLSPLVPWHHFAFNFLWNHHYFEYYHLLSSGEGDQAGSRRSDLVLGWDLSRSLDL